MASGVGGRTYVLEVVERLVDFDGGRSGLGITKLSKEKDRRLALLFAWFIVSPDSKLESDFWRRLFWVGGNELTMMALMPHMVANAKREE